MSYGSILGASGLIQPQYLPAVAPSGVQNPMTSNLNSGGFGFNCPVDILGSQNTANLIRFDTPIQLNPQDVTLSMVGPATVLSIVDNVHICVGGGNPLNVGQFMEFLVDANGDGTIKANGANVTTTLNQSVANFNFNGNPTTVNVTGAVNTSGQVKAESLAYTLGSPFISTETLGVTGTVVVAFPTITAQDRVIMTVRTFGGTPGFLSYTINPGVGFTITSTSNADTSSVEVYVIPVQ